MSKLEVFDPPMCCSTGVCGADADARLVRFAADLDWLTSQGVDVRRYNLAQEPQTFMANEQVKAIVSQGDSAALPVVVLDGRVVSQGVHLTRDQLVSLVRSSIAAPAAVSLIPGQLDAPKRSGGCCGSEGCC